MAIIHAKILLIKGGLPILRETNFVQGVFGNSFKWAVISMNYVYIRRQLSPNYASVNTLQAPTVASGLQARRGFEGVYLASGRPMRRRGRAGREMEEEGDLDD